MERRVRLGRALTGEDLHLDLNSAGHAVFTGRTRSGKTVQVMTLLAQCAHIKGVEIAGVDPSAVLFGPLGGFPSEEKRALGLNVEKIAEVLDILEAELDSRLAALLSSGVEKFDLRAPDAPPVLIVIFEEYPGLISALDQISGGSKAKNAVNGKAIQRVVSRLGLEGAKVGIRVWIMAQRADASLLTGVLRASLTQRFSFAQDAEGLKMLHESISDQQLLDAAVFKPGQAYAQISGELPLTRYRADLIEYSEYVKCFKSSPDTDTEAFRDPEGQMLRGRSSWWERFRRLKNGRKLRKRCEKPEMAPIPANQR